MEYTFNSWSVTVAHATCTLSFLVEKNNIVRNFLGRGTAFVAFITSEVITIWHKISHKKSSVRQPIEIDAYWILLSSNVTVAAVGVWHAYPFRTSDVTPSLVVVCKCFRFYVLSRFHYLQLFIYSCILFCCLWIRMAFVSCYFLLILNCYLGSLLFASITTQRPFLAIYDVRISVYTFIGFCICSSYAVSLVFTVKFIHSLPSFVLLLILLDT